jgi:hypothetical protein
MNEPATEVATQPPVEISRYFQATDSLGKSLMRVLVSHLKALPGPWNKLAEKRQEELLEQMGDEVHQAVQHGARQLIGYGLPHVVATLQQITIKDGVKATVVFDRAEETLDVLSHQVGRQLVLVLADPQAFAEGVHDFEADADQNPLPLDEPKTPHQGPVGNGTPADGEDDDGED